jgi:hypothetical protein
VWQSTTVKIKVRQVETAASTNPPGDKVMMFEAVENAD